MKSRKISISKQQLGSFKEHAFVLSGTLSFFSPELKLTGRRRVNFLARICGYPNHSSMCVHAKQKSNTSALVLFSPDRARLIAARIVRERPSISLDMAIAALVKSSSALYRDKNNRWTVGDIMEFGDGVFHLLFHNTPNKSSLVLGSALKLSPRIGRNTQQVANNSAMRALRQFANSPAMSAVQRVVNSPEMRAFRQFANSSVMSAVQRVVDSPKMRAFRQFANSPAMSAVQRVVDSPEMRAFRQFANSPAMSAVQCVVNSPEMRAFRQFTKIPALSAAQRVINSPEMHAVQQMANSSAVRLTQEMTNGSGTQAVRRSATHSKNS